MSEEKRAEFERQLGHATWRELRPHAARDGLVFLKQTVELVEAAIALAEDDAVWVQNRLTTGELWKPTAAELEHLEKNHESPFHFLIVQPFVLAQAIVD